MRIHASLALGVVTVALLGGCLARSRDPYQSCFVNSDCFTASDRCLTVTNGSATDSICSTPCSSSAQCPLDRMGASGDCRAIGATGGSNCYQACASASDCNAGFGCVDPDGGSRPICLPIGSTRARVAAYESCRSADCDATTEGCFGITNGSSMTNVCTTSCRSDSDCPFDSRGGRGACFDIAGGSMGVCFERCNVSGDCNLDASCTDRTASGLALAVPICLPG